MESNIGYPDGFDVDWLAVDCHGHLAVFLTGGEGPVATSLFNRPGYGDRFGKWVKQLYLTPRDTEAHLVPTGPGHEPLLQYAGRGIHVFDWTDCARRGIDRQNRYERSATPSVSAAWGDTLPEDLAVRMDGIDFSAVAEIDVVRYCPCLFPEGTFLPALDPPPANV